MLGSIIKRFREEQNLTQQELYTGLLSKRQAIRFENGEVDLKANSLLTVMSRLELDLETLQHLNTEQPKSDDTARSAYQQLKFDSLEDPAPLAFYEQYRNSADPKVKQLAIMAHLKYWLDADLPTEERLWLATYYLDKVSLTIDQLTILLKEVLLLDPMVVESTFQRIADNLARFKFHSDYYRLSKLLLQNRFWYAIEIKALPEARKVLADPMWQADNPTLNEKMSYLIFQQFVEIADTDSRVAVEQIKQITGTLFVLSPESAQFIQDGYLDTVRHLRQLYGYHVVWSDEEIGVIVRLLESIPKKAKQDLGTYLQGFPGLTAAIAKKGNPLSYYRDK
ncbi:helix-turn-helix domain-containing protein [Lapidilactobacillus mulanensis]|uniref:Helix-turn-helix domain-containing protein n=1 Tax=Lapidilactobacillus mulanensis TaxID=2485999 RepID=A0ABW4DPG0_9LACO|nr:helix-turn-helix transcriptional regulator [Lapidilactobacillus mulanensis]